MPVLPESSKVEVIELWGLVVVVVVGNCSAAIDSSTPQAVTPADSQIQRPFINAYMYFRQRSISVLTLRPVREQSTDNYSICESDALYVIS